MIKIRIDNLINNFLDEKKYGYLVNYRTPKTIYLPKKMTIKEIYKKLNENSYRFKNKFKLQNHLFSKKIKFKYDKDLKITITLKVKGYAVTTKATIFDNEIYSDIDRIYILQNGEYPIVMIKRRYNYVKEVNDAIADILIT